jgi:hypothetical protein
MKIKQAYISKSVESFKMQFFSKYGLIDYKDRNSDIIMFGLYSEDDYLFYNAHEGFIVLVWCGSDGMWLNQQKANIIKQRSNVRHIAIGGFLCEDLQKYDIKHEFIPVSPTIISDEIKVKPKGQNVYSYGTNDWSFYNLNLAVEAIKKTGFPYVFSELSHFTRENIIKVYESAFINLRLTVHDGLPNTVIEMGLMGRRSVYNGNLPNCIKWTDEKSIVDAINNEAYEGDFNNKRISEEMKDFLNISDKWMQI